MAEDFLDVDELASTLRVSVGSFVWRLRQSYVPDELRAPEVWALSRLERGGPATVSYLARSAEITPQGMASTVAGLETRGFVARRADPTDGRRVLLSVTEAG